MTQLEAVVAAAGSVDAAAEQLAFCEREYEALARYAYRLVRDEQLARDVTQEAFVRLFARWTKVTEPRPYLYLVATNVVRRHFRRHKTETAAYAVTYEPDDTADGPDFDVRDVVARLPRKWREVVVLHYFADLTIAEIALRLHQPEGTVKRRLHEARGLLARGLGDQS